MIMVLISEHSEGNTGDLEEHSRSDSIWKGNGLATFWIWTLFQFMSLNYCMSDPHKDIREWLMEGDNNHKSLYFHVIILS